jgi:hypothetical protein
MSAGRRQQAWADPCLENCKLIYDLCIGMCFSFQVTSEYPGYLLTTPTVVDLDGVGGPLEVILGTSAGNLMVFDNNWKNRTGFPLAYDVLHSQVKMLASLLPLSCLSGTLHAVIQLCLFLTHC